MPFVAQPGVQAAPWGAEAVRDTIAAVVRHPDYQRALTDSLWNRIGRWLVERIADLIAGIRGSPTGRTVTIALLVLVVALIVARIVIGINAERGARRAPRALRTAGTGAAMFSDAERLAAAGDFTGAAHALFAALLAACAARGEIRLHSSKTTGDYARELRMRQSSSLRAFQAFRARYDRVIYGDLQCSADDYAALSREARSLTVHERAA